MSRRLVRFSLVLVALLLPAAWPLAAAPISAPLALAEPASPAPDASQETTPDEPKRPLLRQRAEQRVSEAGEIGRTFSERIEAHLPGVVAGVALFLLFWFSARLSGRVLRRVFARSDIDPALAQLALPLVRMSLMALGVLVALEQMGFNISSLLAGVSIAGLAVGLAAQETLSNLLAGFALLWDRPFRLGDSVTVGGRFGTVTEIGFRSTRLRTLEQLEVTIPNKEVAQQQIVNHSRYPQFRVNVPFTVGYGEGVDRVRELLFAAVAERTDVLAEPAPQLVVTALADLGVALELRLWVRSPTPDSATLFQFLEMTKSTLDRAGVAFPFPQRMVHIVGPTPVRDEPAAG